MSEESNPTKPGDLDQRARALHAWFCTATGQRLPLRMDTLTRWMDWLLAGHNGPELKKVILYLRRQISAGKRNHGSLSLGSLLDIPNFEKDLGLADMVSRGKMDPEAALAALPVEERGPAVRQLAGELAAEKRMPVFASELPQTDADRNRLRNERAAQLRRLQEEFV